MLFNSLAFLVFAPVVLLGHALLQGKAMRIWLLVMSYVFYVWGQPWWCLGLLCFSTVLDYWVAIRIEEAPTQAKRRAWLLASLIGNLGVLAGFKYLPFILRSTSRLLGFWHVSINVPDADILLPPGISFYTFQTLSYTIDVYRRQMKPARRLLDMALFVAFFPHLVAGPIQRASILMHQLAGKQPRTREDLLQGLTRVLWGLMKKMVFADWLGLFVAPVFGYPEGSSGLEIWLATYAFAFQIYLDFSAYSDIAIGVSRMMGVHLPENFRWPYLSRNISEFWRRWHMSLSAWLRDYLYIPLGGSRKGPNRTVVNMFIVMLLGGLWHGAAIRFIVWGLWIGLGLAIYHTAVRLGWAQRESESYAWSDFFGIFITFHWMCVSWVFFRANSVTDALLMLQRMCVPMDMAINVAPKEVIRTAVILGIVLIAHAVRGLGLGLRFEQLRSRWATGLVWGGLAVATLLLLAPTQAQFIYFQF
jgi:D-alanyl-lipoteichoic acid acyltransferase DltB (MBOAT superfamily)